MFRFSSCEAKKQSPNFDVSLIAEMNQQLNQTRSQRVRAAMFPETLEEGTEIPSTQLTGGGQEGGGPEEYNYVAGSRAARQPQDQLRQAEGQGERPRPRVELKKARVLFDFKAETEDEISLKAGEIGEITIL